MQRVDYVPRSDFKDLHGMRPGAEFKFLFAGNFTGFTPPASVNIDDQLQFIFYPDAS